MSRIIFFTILFIIVVSAQYAPQYSSAQQVPQYHTNQKQAIIRQPHNLRQHQKKFQTHQQSHRHAHKKAIFSQSDSQREMSFSQSNILNRRLVYDTASPFSLRMRFKNKSRHQKYQKPLISMFKKQKKHLNQFKYQLRFKEASQTNSTKKAVDLDIDGFDGNCKGGNGGVLLKGWMKFLKFIPEKGETMDQFFFNPAYLEQEKKNYDKGEQDESGFIDIPDENSFFFHLTKSVLLGGSGRRNDIVQTIAALSLSKLYNQQPGSEYKGGIEDVGDFDEGFAFKLIEKDPDGDVHWVFAVETAELKQQWMEAISEAKVNMQKEEGNIHLHGVDGEAIVQTSFVNNQYNTGYQEKYDEGHLKVEIKKDGFWMVVQDWSTCTVACGTGTQTQQRFCNPPQNGGLPCSGDPIITRLCNTQPCPFGDTSAIDTQTEPLKVKMMRVSMRPQRYETCIVKEGDLDLVREDLVVFQKKPRIPARAVLNNRTFTIFENDHYDSVLFSVQLSKLKVEDLADDPKQCFIVSDPIVGKHVTLCIMNTVDPQESVESQKENWVKQIFFFRDFCHDELKPNKEDPIVAIKRQELEQALLFSKSSQGGNGLPSNAAKTEQLQNSLLQIQKVSLSALSKEQRYEQMMEEEEINKQMKGEMELKKQLELMREKEQCMEQELNKKENEQLLMSEQKTLQNRMEKMKENIKWLIQTNREEQAQKMHQVQAQFAQRNSKAIEEIQNLRMNLAAKMIQAEKQGDKSKCVVMLPDEQQAYCEDNFNDSPFRIVECKDPNKFCETCCEHEFGSFHMDERNICLEQCPKGNDDEPGPHQDAPQAGLGAWVWVPEANKVN